MRSVFGRAALAAGAALLVLGVSAGSASAIAEPAALGFEPAAHEFGPVPLGQHRDLTLTLSNSGGRASTGLTVALTGSAAYAITADECSGHTLGPRKSCTVMVRFAPTANGAANATVTVTGKHRVAPASATVTGRGGGFGSGAPDRLYWTSGNSGTFVYSVYSSPLTANPLTVTPVVTPLTGANYLAVDQNNVYWTDDLNIVDGTISSAPLAGGSPTKLVGGLSSPQGIAVGGGYLYVADSGSSGTIKRAPVTGGPPTTLVSGQTLPTGVAVDSTGVYWTTFTASTTGGAIRYAPFTTTGVGAETVLIGGLNSPNGVAVDNGQVYWTDFSNGTVNSRAISGGAVTVIASGQIAPTGVDVTDAQAYWATGDGSINTAPLGGQGPVTNLYNSIFDAPNGVAIPR